MDVQIDTFLLGPMQTNTYLLRGAEACWVIDPAPQPEPLVEHLRAAGAAPQRILLTHGHADHIGGVERLRGDYPGCEVCCPAGDAAMLADAEANLSAVFLAPITVAPAERLLRPGQTLTFGRSEWRVLDSSGHTPGGVSFYWPGGGVVFTGDALFAGGIGRVDLPGSSASRLLGNIRSKLLSLPDDTRVLAGHGPETTIGVERRSNPFFSDPEVFSKRIGKDV